MAKHLPLFSITVLLVILGLSIPTTARGNYRAISDTTYIVEYRFTCAADSESLLNLLFYFNHLQGYAAQPELTITLLAGSPQQQDILYDYESYFIKGSATFRRTLDRARGEINFAMLSSKQNSKLVPHAIASSGWYRVTPIAGDSVPLCTVAYYQITTIDQSIGWFYRRFARQQADDFFARLETYIRAHAR